MSLFVKFKKALILAAVFATFMMTVGLISPTKAFAQEGDRKIKSKVNPTYPELAKHTNISGTVKLEATISPNGNVKAVRLIGGHPLLAGAAEDALKKWKYEPSSTESTAVVEFKFNPGM